MNRVRFIMVGGFLGAGKTTTIARLAQHYINEGKKVGLVTNDQAYNLVDTQLLRAKGFDVGEVPGACFCCKFDDLIKTTSSLSDQHSPDIIISEPVGSCTDLVATVLEPLRQLYKDQFELGPLAVLLKPEHGRKILRNEQSGFSPKAAYIFLKQIEEADVVVLNKTDKLSVDEREELVELVGERYPDKRILATSAKHGDEFEAVINAVSEMSHQHISFMDVDYKTYAEGEAELGWLNCQADFNSIKDGRFSLDDLVKSLVETIRDGLAQSGDEAAHLKILGQSGVDAAVANLVGAGVDVEMSLESEIKTTCASVIVNARVATDPETLEQLVRDSIESVANNNRLEFSVTGVQRFRPSPPVPTHRVTSTESA